MAPPLPVLDGAVAGERVSAAGARAPTPPAQVEEVIGLIRSISIHLDTQNNRADRMITSLDRLCRAVEIIPELNRQNARLLELMTEHLANDRRGDDSLRQALGGVTDASNRQTDVLGLLQQQLDANNRSSDVLIDGMSEFRDAIGQLAGSASRTTAALTEMTNAGQQRETELAAILSKSQRWMTWAVAGGMIAAAAAVTMAVITMVS